MQILVAYMVLWLITEVSKLLEMPFFWEFLGSPGIRTLHCHCKGPKSGPSGVRELRPHKQWDASKMNKQQQQQQQKEFDSWKQKEAILMGSTSKLSSQKCVFQASIYEHVLSQFQWGKGIWGGTHGNQMDCILILSCFHFVKSFTLSHCDQGPLLLLWWLTLLTCWSLNTSPLKSLGYSQRE